MLRYALIAVLALSLLVTLSGCPKPVPSAPTSMPADAGKPAPGTAPTLPPSTDKAGEKAPADKAAGDKPAGKDSGAGVKVPGDEGKTAKTTASGLQYIVLDEGKGEAPKKGDIVTAEYTGWLTDGKKFDSSKDHPGDFTFPVGMGQVIPGWDEAFLTMKPGERRKLIIPGKLAYGAKGTPDGTIPPDATLVFEVKLVKVAK